MKQPREGITGVERDPADYLLTVSGKAALTAIYPALYGALLHKAAFDSRGPEVFDRMHAPQVGEQVFVMDTMYAKELSHESTGYLIEHRAEFGTTDEEWLAELAYEETLTAEDRYIEQNVWYIQYGPHAVDVCRWTNCTVLTIPARPES
jgi:hypothetical protein